MIEILDSELQKFMSENKVAEITKYRKENLEQRLKELSGLAPVCQLAVYYHFEEHSDKYTQESGYRYSLEYTDVHVRYRGYELLPMKKNNNATTYKFSLAEKDKRKQLTYFRLSDYGLENQPQAIGKATESKMDAWLDYLLKVKEAEQDYVLKSNGKIQEFKSRLAPFKRQLTWLGSHKGYITKNGILYSFELTENGQVHQRIKLDESILNSVENFAALSDNRYQQTDQRVLLLYTCDAWHTASSKELVAPFSNEYRLKQYLDGLVAGKLKPYDVECLQEKKQTQGHETNYMIEEFPVDPTYKSE